MAKLTDLVLEDSNVVIASEEKCKVDRNIVALVNEKGLAYATNGNDIKDWYRNSNTIDAAIEGLIDILERVPDNEGNNLIAKPYKIVLPKILSGIVTGAFLDWVRTGRTIGTGEPIPEDRLANYAKIMKLVSRKYGNVQLVADFQVNKKDETTTKIVNSAWDTLRAELAKVVQGTSALCKPAGPSALDQKLIEYADKAAAALEAGNMDVYNAFNNLIANLKSGTPASATTTETPASNEVPEGTSADDAESFM